MVISGQVKVLNKIKNKIFLKSLLQLEINISKLTTTVITSKNYLSSISLYLAY